MIMNRLEKAMKDARWDHDSCMKILEADLDVGDCVQAGLCVLRQVIDSVRPGKVGHRGLASPLNRVCCSGEGSLMWRWHIGRDTWVYDHGQSPAK